MSGTNKRLLLNIFAKQSSGVHFCHFNARSIVNKIDEFRSIFRSQVVDIIMVSETWMNADLPDVLIGFPGYNLYREDRGSGRGGGVAIYVKKGLKVRILSSANEEVEFLMLEVSYLTHKFLTGSVYIPPNCSNWINFEDSLREFSSRYENVIIGGDFNSNLLSNHYRMRKLTEIVSSCVLHTAHNQVPTHFSNAEPSLIDFFIISQKESVLFGNQISLHGLTDHDLIFITYDLRPPGTSVTVKTYRDYKNIDSDNLFVECNTLPWDEVYFMLDPDEQIGHFTNLFIYLFEKYVPVRITRHREDTPWLSTEIERLIVERDYLYQKHKNSRCERDFNNYISVKKLVKRRISSAKKAYLSLKLNPKLPSKKLWARLRNMGALNPENKSAADFSPDDFNEFFSKQSAPSQNHHLLTSNAGVALNSSSSRYPSNFSIHNIQVGDVAIAVNSIKSNSIGPDGVCPRFLKLILPAVITQLTHIFNSCISKSIFPNRWKVARVIPIPKKNRASDIGDFRPISILPFLSKVLERLVSAQLKSYLESNRILCKWQSGFRNGHSTTTALLKITDDIRIGIDKNEITVLALLDFTKAFDSVDHTLLIKKLRESFGFSNDAARFFGSYLSDRFQFVDSSGGTSSLLPVLSGVPQGSINGPILFSMFIDDVHSVLTHCDLHMYADDIQIYITSPLGLIEDAISRLNEDLNAILIWSKKNNLNLNPNKCNSLYVFKEKIDSSDFSPILLGTDVIPVVDRVKNLGLFINSSFNWSDHVNYILGKLYGTLRRLWATAKFAPRTTRVRLIQSLVVPIITYADVVYAGLDSGNRRRLNVAFNDCVRFAFQLRRFDHVSAFSHTILGLPLDSYFKFRICTFIHGLLRDRRPKYLFDKLTLMGSSSRSGNLILPRYTCLATSRSFFTHGVKVYNKLPLNIKRAGSAGGFRRLAFNFFSETDR